MTTTALPNVFNETELRAELALDEGKRAYPYVDTRGKTGIAIGRNLTDRGLSADEITLLYNNDIAATLAVLDAKVAWWRKLPPNQQRVMINLCFNMGWPVFSSFVHFLAAMKAGDIATAAKQLQNSVWYTQVGQRGPRMVARLMGP